MRNLRALSTCALLACVLAGASRAAPGLLVGMDDDTLKWADKAGSNTTIAHARNLGIRAVRVTVPWHPGQTVLSVDERIPVDQMILTTWAAHFRVVLAVYGRAAEAPQTAADRNGYCTFVASLLRRYPGVVDVVIWNEANSGRFWRPQFDGGGNSVGPAQYEALLADCYDILHRVRPGVNVIVGSAPRGNDNPAAALPSHSPVEFYKKLGDAYRASGRRAPIFDTVGHNPYPMTNSERPWAKHGGGTISEGDYDKLMSTLTEAFDGTGQPVPGQRRVAIWYMEQGFQTAVDPAKAALYRGVENIKDALPPWLSRTVAASSEQGPAPDQGTQITDALRVAYCQPAVAAFFNFEIADEPSLGGWQSGLLWVDGTPKPSYDAFRAATRALAARQVDCAHYAELAAGAEIGFSAGPAPSQPTKPAKKKPPIITVQ